jgi:glycosyltransferase involved in cell wall biosynthesis
MKPFFSIIVPTYNRADLIKKTLDSLLAQQYEHFEIIVVDDGSTDNTEEIVGAIKDPRIAYYKKSNAERGAARNFGIQRARGVYITFIDSDDLMLPNALQNACAHIERLKFPNCFAQSFVVMDAITGKQLQAPKFVASEKINDLLMKGNFLGCIGVFVKNEILQTINFEEDRRFAGTEDWLLWLRLAARYPFHYSNVVCASMIEHENRSVLGFSEEKLLYRTNQIKNLLAQDQVFLQAYGVSSLNKIYAHMLSYTALHLAMQKDKIKALRYFLKSLRIDFTQLFTRRTLGIFKTILIQ